MRRLTDEEADERFRAADWTPLEPYVGAGVPRRCTCNICGDEGTPRLSQLPRSRGCKKCGYATVRRKLQEQKTDLDKIEAVYARAGVTPLEPWVNANTKRLVRCNTCGFEARIGYSGIFAGQGGCRRCGRAKVTAMQLVPVEQVDAVFVEHGLEPLGPYVGTNSPRLARCVTCGREVTARYNALQSGKQKGCRYCSYKQMGDAKKLPEEEADKVFLTAGVEPISPYVESTAPRLCRCLTCGREVSPSHNSLQNGQGGCKYCAVRGLDRAAPGIVYLIKSESFQALKIGVTTEAARRQRVEQHESSGWEVVEIWNFDNGQQAEQVETALLAWWRFDLGAPEALTSDDMPQAGHSETAGLVFVSVEETVAKVKEFIAQVRARGSVAPRLCTIGGCDEPVRARGWCALHYQRWRRYKDPLWERNWKASLCSADGCERTSATRGMCNMHYKRWWRSQSRPG